MKPGRVAITTAYYPNLVAHAFAVAGLSNSRTDYCAGLDELGQRFREQTAGVLAAGSQVGFAAPMAGGPLFTFIYQIPARAGVESAAGVKAVFEASERALGARTLGPLMESYPAAASDWGRFYPGPWLDFVFSGDPAPKIRLLLSISSLLQALAGDHFDEWWPGWRRELSSRAAGIQSVAGPLRLVHRWEQHLGVPCPSGGLRVLLSRPDRTSASSVGGEAIVAGEGLSDEQVVRSVLHEIGVRMFDPPRAVEIATGRRTGGEAGSEAGGREFGIKEYGWLLRCVEAAACAEKQAVAAAAGLELPGGVDPFVRAMGLTGLVEEWAGMPAGDPVQRVVALFEATYERLPAAF